MKTRVELLTTTLRRGLKPTEKLTVADWAAKYRIISSGNAEPGRWKNSRTPYLKEVMNSFSDPDVHRVILKSSAQIGKSECIQNVIGRFVHLDPCPIMIVQPTIEMSQDYSKRRLAPMIRDCAVLSKLFYDDRGASKSRDANQTILSKFFPGGSLVLAGANSPAGLASRPIRIVLFDEVDRFPLSAASEGDPIDIASKRTATFWNYKIGIFSTPTLENESRIEEAYLQGTQEVWSHECPKCNTLHEIEFKDIFEEDGKIYWKCQVCNSKFPEIVMKNASASYVRQNSDSDPMTRSFFVNGFSSPWVEWRDILREYEMAKGNPEREQVVINTRLGKTYKPHMEIKEIKDLLERREEYKSELPEGVILLTASVDVQDSRLEYEICGWGIDEERWGIKYGMIIGKPSVPKVWELLDEVLDREYKFSDGHTLRVYRTFIDSGGHYTSSVYDYIKPRQNRGRFAIKGVGRSGIPLLDKTLNHGGIFLTSLGVNEGKAQIYNRLQIMNHGEQFMHYPLDDNMKRYYDEKYFRGIMSEHLVEHISGGRKQLVFEPISKHTRNEPLDLAVYNLACMKSLRISHEKWLELAGSKSIEVKQKTKSKKIQTHSIE